MNLLHEYIEQVSECGRIYVETAHITNDTQSLVHFIYIQTYSEGEIDIRNTKLFVHE